MQAYRSYLRNTPDAPNREDVQRFINELQLAPAGEARASAHAPPANELATPARPEGARRAVNVAPTPVAVPPPIVAAPRAPVTDKPIYKKWWLWTTVIGVAAVGVGVGLAVYYGTRTFEPTLAGFSQGSALTVRY